MYPEAEDIGMYTKVADDWKKQQTKQKITNQRKNLAKLKSNVIGGII